MKINHILFENIENWLIFPALVDQSELTHEKWLKNPENAFLNKSEDAQKCIERSKCSYHSHGQAGAVGLLRDWFGRLSFYELFLPFSSSWLMIKSALTLFDEDNLLFQPVPEALWLILLPGLVQVLHLQVLLVSFS